MFKNFDEMHKKFFELQFLHFSYVGTSHHSLPLPTYFTYDVPSSFNHWLFKSIEGKFLMRPLLLILNMYIQLGIQSFI